jgi:hypothetical protein
MKDRFSQCRLESHIMCDMEMKCLLCIENEDTWANTWIKAVENGYMDYITQSQKIEHEQTETQKAQEGPLSTTRSGTSEH